MHIVAQSSSTYVPETYEFIISLGMPFHDQVFTTVVYGNWEFTSLVYGTWAFTPVVYGTWVFTPVVYGNWEFTSLVYGTWVFTPVVYGDWVFTTPQLKAMIRLTLSCSYCLDRIGSL